MRNVYKKEIVKNKMIGTMRPEDMKPEDMHQMMEGMMSNMFSGMKVEDRIQFVLQ